MKLTYIAPPPEDVEHWHPVKVQLVNVVVDVSVCCVEYGLEVYSTLESIEESVEVGIV